MLALRVRPTLIWVTITAVSTDHNGRGSPASWAATRASSAASVTRRLSAKWMRCSFRRPPSHFPKMSIFLNGSGRSPKVSYRTEESRYSPPQMPGNPAPVPRVFPVRCSLCAGRVGSMIRLRYSIALAVGVVGIGTVALASSPELTPAQARADIACRDRGVQPPSAAWELCLSHVTRAYEWGEIGLAQQLAHAAGDARENCLERGLAPNSAAYRACIGRE